MNPQFDYHFIAYCIYLPIMLLLTWYVARMLFRNGKIFMLDIFHNKEDIASATNALFKTGFYLLNLGYGLWILEIYSSINSVRELFEALSPKVGGFSIYLGIMLFFNLYFFFRGRRKSREKHQPHQADTAVSPS